MRWRVEKRMEDIGNNARGIVYNEKKENNRMHRSVVMILLSLLTITLLSGCSLAKEDAGEEVQVNTDRLVGTFVTTEYLSLFDMEAYLNDHADELVSGVASGDISDGEIIDGTSYNERIYATVDKHDSTDPSDWEISFGDIEGICFFSAKWQNEGEEPFTMITGGDEICDVTQHLNVTDEGETVALEGTMYALVGEDVDEVTFFLNPVYQTETGEIYVTAGMGHSMTGDIGGSFSIKLDEETTITENGESKVYGGAVELTIEILDSAPAKVRIYYMDNDLGILHTEEYAAGEVPYSIYAVEGTTCVVVETEWTDGEITREMYGPEEGENTYVEIFYKISDVTLGKQNTEVIWE